MVEKALELSKPVAATAGAITRAINNAGCDVRRDTVKRTLEKMVADGEAMVEYWPVTRNGFLVSKAAHYYAPVDEALDEIPF